MPSIKKISVPQLILIFTVLVLSINFISRIINIEFKFEHLLTWDTLIYEVGIEGVLLILCALITYYGTFFIKDFTFLQSMFRAFIFAMSYITLSFVFMLFIVEWKYLDIFNGFLKYFSGGIKDGITLVFVWMILDREKESNTNGVRS